MDAGVGELLHLVCAYVWRVACVLMETREGTKREILLHHVRAQRRQRVLEEARAEEAVEHEGSPMR